MQSEHARFVYNLQETESRSEDSDGSDAYRWDSDDSHASSSRRQRHVPKVSKKRMSIISNQHFDIPSYENGFESAVPGRPNSRRRFFQSVARWDAGYQKVMVSKPSGDDLLFPVYGDSNSKTSSSDEGGSVERRGRMGRGDDESGEDSLDEDMESDEEDEISVMAMAS